MILEMTTQFRVSDMKEGQEWYETLLNKKPDFIPHEGFAEWELIPGCWLQVAEGTLTEGNGPLRLGVTDIESERDRLVEHLHIDRFDIHSRSEVPVKWGTFSDPWGNQLGFFEYLDKSEEKERAHSILGK
ncbi:MULTISPECIES: VOC family protein [Pontibacillus]|uniref:VOC family protein n=1 Tax=Pontibacillus chungwhensis TaxID=265426 RepID=A0ABY8V1E8_9BACI|nr:MULTISPECIES: VOC family protein [Pontibacillus]MCD5322160.1 VOC family protein [Pontibacillus sp. HN14]WIF99455.1 VOC family protein [Pontibacillus chungwhensis]